MATDYLLPCTCGRTHRISSRQAGDKLACPCGISLDVPTIRGLKDLELAAPTAPPRQRQWGVAQGLMFLGLVTVGAGVAAGCYFSLLVMPAPIETDIPQAWLDQMTLGEGLGYWSYVQQGITKLLPTDAKRLEYLAHERTVATNGVHLAWLVTTLGGAVSAAGIVVRRIQRGR